MSRTRVSSLLVGVGKLVSRELEKFLAILSLFEKGGEHSGSLQPYSECRCD